MSEISYSKSYWWSVLKVYFFAFPVVIWAFFYGLYQLAEPEFLSAYYEKDNTITAAGLMAFIGSPILVYKFVETCRNYRDCPPCLILSEDKVKVIYPSKQEVAWSQVHGLSEDEKGGGILLLQGSNGETLLTIKGERFDDWSVVLGAIKSYFEDSKQ